MMGQEIPVEEYNATGVVNGVRVNVTSQGTSIRPSWPSCSPCRSSG